MIPKLSELQLGGIASLLSDFLVNLTSAVSFFCLDYVATASLLPVSDVVSSLLGFSDSFLISSSFASVPFFSPDVSVLFFMSV